MTRERMNRMLELYPGVGAIVTTLNGLEVCYFYQDFEDETDNIKRAMKQLYPLQAKGKIKTITFVSNEIARKAVNA